MYGEPPYPSQNSQCIDNQPPQTPRAPRCPDARGDGRKGLLRLLSLLADHDNILTLNGRAIRQFAGQGQDQHIAILNITNRLYNLLSAELQGEVCETITTFIGAIRGAGGVFWR